MRGRPIAIIFRRQPWMLLLVGIIVISTLSGCQKLFSQAFTLEFPETVNLGRLELIEDVNCMTCGNGREEIGTARGKQFVRLQNGWYISLTMPQNASGLMPYLNNPSLSPIGEIRLAGSDVKDADLQYLAGLHLRSLDLSNTAITGAGLKYLKPHEKWFSINLQGCPSLNPKYLAHFKGWRRATIGLMPSNLESRDYAKPQLELQKAAQRIICNNQSEQICGTQIR